MRLEEPLPRRGPWTSKQLGIPYPYIDKIYIGVCGSKEYKGHGHEGPWDDATLGGAHTHCCPQDPVNGMVCFGSLDYVYSWTGEASVTFWHEYAHLLEDGVDFACPHDKKEFVTNFDAIQETGHGKRWKEIMYALGQVVPRAYFESGEECEEFYRRMKYNAIILGGARQYPTLKRFYK